ncbi:MAG: Ig-like domain-containing protein [Ruminiclostridium sp.]|nr:Ig-like domain-containing protein [Ruminiclostridium sp.]
MVRRITGLLLALIMAAGVLPSEVFAESVQSVEYGTQTLALEKSTQYEYRYLSSGMRYNFAKYYKSSYKWLSGKVTWSSTNKKVAKVNSKGRVTALKAGNATIKAKSSKGDVLEITVNISAPASVSVWSGHVSTSDVSLMLDPYLDTSYAEKLGATGYYVSYYNKVKKAWEPLYYSPTIYDNYLYCLVGLSPDTSYKTKISLYKFEGGKIKTLASFTNKVRTEKEHPHITKFVKNTSGKKITVAWDTFSDEWDGYQVEYTRYLSGYQKAVNKYWYGKKVDKYTKVTKTKTKKSSIKIALVDGDENVSVRVRGYKKVGKKTVYSEYSRPYKLNSIEYIINNTITTGVAGKVYNDTDQKIVDMMLHACMKHGLSYYEMIENISSYVRRLGAYEYDLSKINSDPLQALVIYRQAQCYQWAAAFSTFMSCAGFPGVKIVGGTKHGANHWWCELVINGTTYLLDPYPSGTFFEEYTSDGYYTKIYG